MWCMTLIRAYLEEEKVELEMHQMSMKVLFAMFCLHSKILCAVKQKITTWFRAGLK